MVHEIDPATTSRAYAYKMWMNAPMPMVTLIKRLSVGGLLRLSHRRNLKFNMLMCWCVGRAASRVKEFYALPVGGRMMQYDALAVNTIVANSQGGVSSCDVPFSDDLAAFNRDYLRLTRQVAAICTDYDLPERMVIGTSALTSCTIDGAAGMYSGIFNNPFMIWGRYERGLFKTLLAVSFQFHHAQMDGAHAAMFLNNLQREIDNMK